MKEALAAMAAQKAVDYLEREGFRILDRDWQHDGDVLSIVAEERGTLVVVEVRVAAGTRYSGPLDVIAPDRKRAVRSLAGSWLTARGMRFAQARIDVIGLLQAEGAFTIEHVRAVG
jgi:putative endonuclease